MRHDVKKLKHTGFTLVELLVALVIGLLAALVIQQVMTVFEGQKRTSSSGSDAQVNGAVALMTIEREVREAGYGLLTGSGLMCRLGINIYYNGATLSNGGSLLPVRIIDGGTASDIIEIVRSDADFGALPISIVKNMSTPSDEITVDRTGGLTQSQLFIVGARDGSKLCTLMQMSQDFQKTGNGWNLQHNPGQQYLYNPPNPTHVFTVAPAYGIGDVVINMGTFRHRRYEVISERLNETNPVGGGSTPLVDQIVALQAQYGIVDAGGQTITQWCNATADSKCGDWSNPTANDILRVRAMRIAVVARSVQYEKDVVSPASLALWDDYDPDKDDPAPFMSLTEAQRHYRYKIFNTIVPVRNLIWGTS